MPVEGTSQKLVLMVSYCKELRDIRTLAPGRLCPVPTGVVPLKQKPLLPWWPMHLAATENVKMKMVNGLSAIGASVNHQSITVS